MNNYKISQQYVPSINGLKIIESRLLTVKKETIVDIHPRNRGFVYHHKVMIDVPDPNYYVDDIHHVIYGHPETIKELKGQVAKQFQNNIDNDVLAFFREHFR